MAAARAGASSAQPGRNSSRSVRANIRLLLPSGALAPLRDCFGRRKRKGEEGASLFSLRDLVRSTPGCPLLGRPFIDRPLFVRSSCNRHYVHIFAAELAIAERDTAVRKCEERVILAHADVRARVPLR